jgi:hypothetical protein
MCSTFQPETTKSYRTLQGETCDLHVAFARSSGQGNLLLACIRDADAAAIRALALARVRERRHVVDPGVQGDDVAGTHGAGVGVPAAALVAAATAGLD